MKLNKSVIEGAVVLTLATALAITAVVSDSSFVRGTSTNAKEYVFDAESESNGVAGISEVLLSKLENGDESNTVTVEKTQVSLVTSGTIDDTTVTRDEISLTDEQVAWLDYLFTDIEGKLNVRSGPSTDYDIIGKIGANARATILERGEGWTKISSGNVEGYVSNNYCIFGVDALAYAQSELSMVATTTATVNVRKSMSTDADVIKAVESGKKLTVSKDTVTEDGWVAVILDDKVGYVSSAYVNVDYNVGTAITLAEEAEIEKKRKAEEMKKKQTSPPNPVHGDAVTLTDEELEVFAALLFCEAGVSYEGMVAAGAAICNRIKSPNWPNSLYGVIYQGRQYSPVYTGKLERQIARGTNASAYKAAREALSGVDPTNGCVNFMDVSTGHAGYVIGDNVFYN